MRIPEPGQISATASAKETHGRCGRIAGRDHKVHPLPMHARLVAGAAGALPASNHKGGHSAETIGVASTGQSFGLNISATSAAPYDKKALTKSTKRT